MSTASSDVPPSLKLRRPPTEPAEASRVGGSPLSYWTAARLLHPSTILLVGTNLVPVVGLLFWKWDAFLVLLSYWMETAVVACWTMLRIAVRPEEATADKREASRGLIWRAFLLVFMVVFTSLFIGVHFTIIWEVFAGDWPKQVHNATEFWSKIVWGTGLWVALAGMVLSRGSNTLLDMIDPVVVRRFVLKLWPNYPGELLTAKRGEPGDAVIGLFARIVLMQVAVLLGGFIAVRVGMSMPVLMPFAILIAIKTYVELSLHVSDWPLSGNAKTAAA